MYSPGRWFEVFGFWGQGSINVDEFLFAISGAYFAAMAHSPAGGGTLDAAHAVKVPLGP